MNSKRLKLASATIGASALVGMGVFTVALSSDNDAATRVSEPEITLGETTTSTTAACTELETRRPYRKSRPSRLTASGRNPVR